METINIFGVQIYSWIVLPVILLVWIVVLFTVKKAVFTALHKIARKTRMSFDDIFIASLDFPLNILIYTSGAAVVERMIPVVADGAAKLTQYFLVGFKAATVVAIVIFVERLMTALIAEYSTKVEVLRSSGGIARGVVRVVVISLGLLILLDSFGVSITPIVASLGIGSLAVALALQPTLENFFSGIQIIIDKPVQVGHFVKLESGEEGYVHKIGWRSTWIRMLPNQMVIMPNKVLVNAKVINYYYPDKEVALLVQVGVHYGSDLQQVEEITIDVARQVQKGVTGAVETFDPFIRYHTYDSSSINFSVILRVKEFVDGYLVKHEFIKRLHARYRKEGITIPYPIRAVNFEQEQLFAKEDFLARLGKEAG